MNPGCGKPMNEFLQVLATALSLGVATVDSTLTRTADLERPPGPATFLEVIEEE